MKHNNKANHNKTNHNRAKTILITATSLFLLTASSQAQPQSIPQQQIPQQPQPIQQPQQIKVEIPKEDLEILKKQKEIEVLQKKIEEENVKDTYEMDKMNRALNKRTLKKNIKIQEKQEQILNSFSPYIPSVVIPVNGIIGKVAITPNIAITEGTQVYNYKIKKVDATKGIMVNNGYMNIYNATNDNTLLGIAGMGLQTSMPTGMPTGTSSPLMNQTTQSPPAIPISTLPPLPQPTTPMR